MKYNPFGLDIGANSIKAVWLSEQKSGYQLLAALTLPTPSKGMLSESPLDQEEMVQAIKKIVTDGKITSQYVNIALPENQVYTRVLEMPILSDKELSSAIYWEAEQYIPVPLQNVTLDWKVLQRPANSSGETKMEVFLVGAPTSLIDKYQKVLMMSGLTISSIETEIISIIRALASSNKFPNSLILNIGAVSTSLAIIKENVIVFTYSISIGGIAINRAIATDFGFTMSQAEEYKRAYGISQDTLGGKIGQATAPVITSIVVEVKKALALYNEKYKDAAPIQQILLCGGTAKLPGIDLFFAKNCGVETVIANPWNILASQQVPKEILDNAVDYTIAVGLAMRNYE
ncbi:MAG: type IV pilus assembly protein PilM [Candidatus Levybacteria bacterium]|nr:type IV pilus assembly protein PilM [Candidatus Levybacteria bacterium]